MGQVTSTFGSPPPVLAPPGDLPAPPRQKRGIETRRRLLTAARQLFAERGYESTSIHDIASRAKVADGALYNHFRSKRQLLVALMTELLEHLHRLDLRPAGAGGEMQEGLRRFLEAVFKADLEYFGVVRAWQEAALTDESLGRMQAQIESWTHARILAVFRLLEQHPLARTQPDLPAFARMMDRHFWSILARGARLSPREFNAEVRVAADAIYYYLFRDIPQAGEGSR